MSLNKTNTTIQDALSLLDYKIDTKEPSLLFVDQLDSPNNRLKECDLIILDKAKIFKADAVYLRRFPDGRLPFAQIYIYDFSEKKDDNTDDYAKIHRNLWSASIVPLFYIITKTKIKIFDCTKPVEISKGNIVTTNPIDILSIINESKKEYDKYSLKLFDNGSFWDIEENKRKYLSKNSVYSLLISGLKKIRSEFINSSGLLPSIAHKLLVQSILIKYLEEKKDGESSVFDKDYFYQFDGATDFCDVLRKKGQFAELLKSLSTHFNGKIFECDTIKEIEGKEFSSLADLLDGECYNNQYVIWKMYSFNYISIELISSIYDEFLGKEKGSVYTPAYLVNFLIDECMPLNKPKAIYSILDPSCGSGIFLVVAFKRLIQWWRIQKYHETGKLKKPSLSVLKKLITENLFGVDIKGDAIQLAAFSLSLALCDELTPKEIWNELKFEDLTNNNLIQSDFFKHKINTERKFDLIIGNPPFIEKIVEETALSILREREINGFPKIPQNQISLLFLEESSKLLKDENSKLCLLIPSGPLLYNNTLTYRKFLLEKLNILQIVDFTLIKNLFDKGKYPVVALFVSNENKKSSNLLHITVQKTKLSNERITFEIDHYDFHYLSYEIAMNSESVWKGNLLGGGRIEFLIDKLKCMRTFSEYLEEMKKNNGWVYGEGYVVGKKVKNEAPYITNKKSLPTEEFKEEGINWNKVVIEKNKFFYSTAFENKDIFKSPHVLIKERLGKKSIPIELVKEEYLTFKHNIVGVHAPYKYINELSEIVERFRNSDLYRFFLVATSSESCIRRSPSIIQMKDILNLPYPKNKSDLSLTLTEEIIKSDVTEYLIDYLKYGEKSKICINYVNDSDIREYSQVFCKVLNSIYAKKKFKFELGRIINKKSFICVKFIYTDFIDKIVLGKNNEELQLENLIYNKIGKNVRITRILKMYDKDSIYFVKLKQLRYWLKSIALRDADEVFKDLMIKGY